MFQNVSTFTPMLTAKEIIKALKISRTTLWRLKKMGLPCLKVAASYRYNKKEVLKWINNARSKEYLAYEDEASPFFISDNLQLWPSTAIRDKCADTVQYKLINIPLSKLPSKKDLWDIHILSGQIKRDDMYVEILGNSLQIYLNQVDLKVLKELCQPGNITARIAHAIENIRSYGIKGKKRIYVDYDKERKVVDRKKEEANRGKYFYAAHNSFAKENNISPPSFINKIICGDSEEILKKLPDNCIDLIFTSPPYNFGLDYENHKDGHFWQEYFDKLFKIFEQCIRVLKYGGRLAVNVQPLFSDYIPTHHIISDFFIKNKMIWKGEILWEKNNYNCKYTAWGSWKSPSNPYLKYTWEFVEIYCKGDLKKQGNKNNIDIAADEFKEWVVAKWSIAPEREMKKFGHPAIFPEELARRVIKLFSYKGDIVLDPFNGIGTTAYAANKLNRLYLGIDVSKEYCRKAVERINGLRKV